MTLWLSARNKIGTNEQKKKLAATVHFKGLYLSTEYVGPDFITVTSGDTQVPVGLETLAELCLAGARDEACP